MPSTASLLEQLRATYPQLTFAESDEFLWSPDRETIFYNPANGRVAALLMHELGHALGNHRDYLRDIQLLSMETEAWERARLLATQHSVSFSEDTVQDHLDTYRDWLHSRSTCPECEAAGHQIARERYRCLACTTEWQVNEARTCRLKRSRIITT